MSKLRKVLGNFLIYSNKNFLFLENFFLFFLRGMTENCTFAAQIFPKRQIVKKDIRNDTDCSKKGWSHCGL